MCKLNNFDIPFISLPKGVILLEVFGSKNRKWRIAYQDRKYRNMIYCNLQNKWVLIGMKNDPRKFDNPTAAIHCVMTLGI